MPTLLFEKFLRHLMAAADLMTAIERNLRATGTRSLSTACQAPINQPSKSTKADDIAEADALLAVNDELAGGVAANPIRGRITFIRPLGDKSWSPSWKGRCCVAGAV